jgi:predicted CopG family antitoxin
MNTTISVSMVVREQLKEYGNKGETYDEIIKRLIESARDRQLQELLMNTEDSISIDEALARAKKRWQ